MPELPEVETIISDLNKKIKGDMIADFWSDWPKAIKGKSLEAFRKEIKGRKILGARRLGKNIFVDLSGGKTIYIHLKMTGHLLIKSKIKNQKSKLRNDYFSDRVNQYVHHIWKLITNNKQLTTKTLEFSDLRKFGKIVLVDADKLKELKEIKKLGVDAIDKEFTFDKFNGILEKRKNKMIRDILMDQNLIAGIGNIYMSEILFDAGILPSRAAEKINTSERKKLYNSIKKILKKAVKLRGTSDSDYRDTSGAPGNFQKVLRVYRREKQKCKKCGTIIKRIKIGQRSAFFCPRCQK
ncbi:MAG: DNA-formamidopyrimidine glycosylase [Candidatus Moranbacteria bacterium RIFCSPHIGHO2_02_FULL_40_12b]|nr:MAG: DNA-formamidopyrimidine glycosylase [Candidatus Moranbacteria bacterium RIFCSPHIGHO2_02_FULL_40_12b]OGI23212.1 MAG: DNA-formamidopyrimidine glycosylase [Candidatus Moranbacteria bacterium RIFCSPHIGHO2_12_FULL_40_10]